MRPTCDILVLGGGPAGTAAALALQRRGLSTVVVERSHYDTARPGETLLGENGPLLVALGVWAQFLAGSPLPAQPLVSAWGDSDARRRPDALDPHGHGWHVDRQWFDAMLARAAERSGALVYCGVRPVQAEPVRHGWRVTLRCAGVETKVEARFVVDATGRSAWMATRMGARRRRIDRLIAFVGRYEHVPADAALLVEAAADGWWYSVPLPDDRAIAVYLTDADYGAGHAPADLYRAAIARTRQTRTRLAPLGEPTVRAVAADTYDLEFCAGRCWVAVGDAAYAVDPLSGSGIRRALETGFHAAQAIAVTFNGARGALTAYQRDTTARFSAQLQARRYYYGLERRWPSSTFWSRRQQT